MSSKKIELDFYEWEIIYILNCICLTRNILKHERRDKFDTYFNPEFLSEYLYDLTLIQKLISYKSNKKLYNYKDYDYFLGQRDFISGDGTFEFLLGKKRYERLLEIKIEDMRRKKISGEPIIDTKKFFKKFWFFKKSA